MKAVLALTMLSGFCTYYSPGLMQTVADNRNMDLGDYAGGVALNDCRHLGERVWLSFGDGPIGPFLVVDCAQPKHAIQREELRYVAEVGAWLAKSLGFYGVGPVPVMVIFDEPRGYKEWE